MIIAKVNNVNKKTNYSNLESSKKSTNAKISQSRFNYSGDKVVFKGLDPVTATILQEAIEGAAHKILSAKKVNAAIAKAHDLFTRYDVKPAIELALGIHEKLGSSFLHGDKADDLLAKGVQHVSNLSDEHLVNRDLKQRVLDHCFISPGTSYTPGSDETIVHRLAENLLANLNGRYFEKYKKHLISKVTEYSITGGGHDVISNGGILHFKRIDEILSNMSDRDYKMKMKRLWLEKKQEYEESMAGHNSLDDIIVM